MGWDIFGGGSYAYGPPPCGPWTPSAPFIINPLWYNGPAAHLIECKFCHHLFATVDDFNQHIDECVKAHPDKK